MRNEKVFFVFWAFLMLGVIARFYFHKRFLERIANHHSELYLALGEPKTFTKYPLSKKTYFKRFKSKQKINSIRKIYGKQGVEVTARY